MAVAHDLGSSFAFRSIRLRRHRAWGLRSYLRMSLQNFSIISNPMVRRSDRCCYRHANDIDVFGFLGPLLAVAVILGLARPGRRSHLAQIAGGLSYPLYLNHWIGVFAVNFVTKRGFPVDFLTFVTAQYALNIGIALALYLAVDRQIQLRRGTWYSEKLGKRLAITSYALVGTGLIMGSAIFLAGY